MTAIAKEKIYRVLDANFNRAKEALRVCEDIARFILDNPSISRKFKLLRHQMTQAISILGIEQLIHCRDIKGDVGKKTISSELKRKDHRDIFYANIQRAKESVRVLEEFIKILDHKAAVKFKTIRYALYAIEKKTAQQL